MHEVDHTFSFLSFLVCVCVESFKMVASLHLSLLN